MAQRRFWGVIGAVVGGGVLAALYAVLVERSRVQLSRFSVALDRPGLPPHGLTILHLSDFHFRAGGAVQSRKIANLKRLLAGERYDLAVLTGDLIHDAPGLPVALGVIESLRPRLAAFSCPGNHDYAEYSVWGVFGQTQQEGAASAARSSSPAHWIAGGIAAGGKLLGFARKVLRNELVRLPVAFNDVPAMHAALMARGVQPLVNRALRVQAEGVDVWVAGVDDLTEGRPDLSAALADVPACPERSRRNAALILLAHNPDIWLDRRVRSADLVLAGHTHGGQVRLPILGAIHTQGTHLTRRRPAGWFQQGESRMFVTRGLGESIPLRLGVRPQVALIRLVPPADKRPG